MLNYRYFVTRSQPRDLRSVKAALYSSARVVAVEEDIADGQSKGYTVAIVEVFTDRNDADFLATYQADRLRSFGGIGVSEVFGNMGSAEMYAGAEYDAYPMRVQDRSPSQVAAESLAREFGTDVSEWTV